MSLAIIFVNYSVFEEGVVAVPWSLTRGDKIRAKSTIIICKLLWLYKLSDLTQLLDKDATPQMLYWQRFRADI